MARRAKRVQSIKRRRSRARLRRVPVEIGAIPAAPVPRRLPWLPVFVRDWLGSPKLARLTVQQEGMLLRLLLFAWESPGCLLPLDENELCTMTKITPGMWEEAGGPKLMALCFERHRDGHVPVEPIDLAAKALRAEKLVAARSRAGLASAAAKAAHAASDTRSTHVEHAGSGSGSGATDAVKASVGEREGRRCSWTGSEGQACAKSTTRWGSLCDTHEREAGVGNCWNGPVEENNSAALDPDAPGAEKEPESAKVVSMRGRT